MRAMAVLISLVAVTGVVARPPATRPAAGGAAAVAPTVTLDERRLDYVEEEDGRAVADVTARLRRDTGPAPGASLELTISAVGPFVDPPPGFAGRRGANRITAEHLEAALASGRLAAETSPLSSGRPATRPARVREGRRGRLPERRLLASGAIDHEARGDRDVPLEVVVEVGPFGDGRYRTEVLFDGRPRLAVFFAVESGGRAGRILAVEAAGHGAPARGEESIP